ncbi:hypothetical protein QJS10_CPA16g01685 [Acorus calamus]|uniref:Uncharacterized protein n=1 Tax=Acorus calamus TaxID=4465 RepID=A0AAV9D4D8_ACOCL|nr:hypothetical protein QJS10_CPA16g01685 [Acorus calamus]
MLVSSASAVPLPSSPPSTPRRDDQIRRTVRTLVEFVRASPSTSGPPVESLRRGDWVKLICGASFEDSADVRNLSLVYALSGGKANRNPRNRFHFLPLLFLPLLTPPDLAQWTASTARRNLRW